MGDLVADIQTVRELLHASLTNNPQKQDEEVYLTVTGTVETVHTMLSLTAEAGHSLHSQLATLEPQTSGMDIPAVQPHSAHPKPDNIFRVPSVCEPSSYIDDIFSSVQSIASTRSSTSRSNSMRLSTHTAPEVTVLFIDIKGFTAECAAMPAGRVGEWVAAFYERVDEVAACYGVSKVEVRGDCCICIAGAEGSVPARAAAAPAAADRRADQATRMLAFAAALTADLATLPGGSGSGPTAARMGVATGEAAFLVSDAADALAGFASVQGDAVNLAARMEALSAPGAVHVHKSTADRWAAEAPGRAAPHTACVECKGRGLQRAAVFDCATRAFRPAPAPARVGLSASAAALGLLGPPAKLRRSASGPI